MTTYSLWVALEPQAERGIAKIIHAAAQRLQTPSFLPHMTLLGGISGISEADAIEKTKQLREATRVLAPEIRAVTSKDRYFQCVFLLLQLSEELAGAFRAAKQLFGREDDDAEFMPHISLVYGDLSEATKDELVAALSPRFDGSAPVKLDRLQLWNTTGAVSAWTLVAEFGLVQRKPQLLAANLATLATVASVAATCTETPSAHGGSSHPPSYHRQAYHPYAKPASATTPCSSSADERDDDDASGGDTDELSLPLVPIPRPQFHPQHHHRLITATLRPSNSPNTGTGTGITSRKKMPRRKETKKIQIDIPSSEASRGIEGDPHQVFKCNGSPIISPRSIRNSLAETDFDVDGNPRPQKVATTDGGSSVITASSKTTSVVLGPVQPPTVAVAAGVVGTKEEDDNNDVDMASGVKTANRRRRVGDSNGGASSASSSRSSTPSDNGNSTGGTSEVDLLALKVEEQSLTGMSGVQLWVHRLLYTHHQTLHVLGLEREAFPNTRLSLKQLECMLSPVIALTDLMRPDHFGIHVPTPQIAQTMSDVHYWKLWESDTIDIGIFFMPPNSHIPLHNHPGMSVVTRILYGSVNIRSYDLVSSSLSSEEEVEKGPAGTDQSTASETAASTEIVGSNPEVKWARVSREGSYASESTMWLDPRRFNLHQIHAASDNGCALLDIMIPPYNNADRDCHHFQILEEKYNKEKNERIVKMIESISKGNHNEPTASSRDAPDAATPNAESS